ncbi:DICT sensory domain-containing protein [Haloarcula nitratireducens]|uniref:Sensor protein n=1 Tax=Haloarcula nitratireducens TaxID=2487749 RepID=A0AAW4PCB3_9EURY|nr:DICT sensory domain-containing protein [Halomicroarcula nitratireducens]MBX0295489.1 sensor protein [Halomicroarcula nitratireducens]
MTPADIGAPTLGGILAEVARRRKTVVVYAPNGTERNLAETLSTRNVSVEHRTLPTIGDDAFVVIRDDGRFRGAISLADLLVFLAPPIERPGDLDSVDLEHRAIFELLDDTLFVTLDRRQLLATSREFEDRAWRTGRGRLHVGFQSPNAFAAQAELYRQLATTTDIDVHVYVDSAVDTDRLDDAPLTVHVEPSDEIGRYWFVLFEDGGDGTQNCGLVAEETAPGQYRGVWTYDRELIARAFAAVE